MTLHGIEEIAHATELPLVVTDPEVIASVLDCDEYDSPVDAVVQTGSTGTLGNWAQLADWATEILIKTTLVASADAAPGRLWITNNGLVSCGQHGGRYLAAAVKADPTAEVHSTPLDHWEAITRAEIHAEGLTCETCSNAAKKAAQDALVASLAEAAGR